MSVDPAPAFGIYVHVPFCASRCGYCDFNTYTATELGSGAAQREYADLAVRELDLAREALADDDRRVATVFFGGGTPTVLPPTDLVRVLRAVDDRFGLADDAEVTTEANAESVTGEQLAELRAGGFTRISFGMQSAREHVLAGLDRRPTPGRALAAAAEAAKAGFRHVNLDLIYGTPGESDADWKASLDAVVSSGVDHVSAYALTVEPGTRLAGRITRGELPGTDDDVLADRYLLAEQTLAAAGFGWYEVSNWSRGVDARSQHNRLYWTGGDWWGIGPGAHSHLAGERWWNVKHPSRYARRLSAGESPREDYECVGPDGRRLEQVMLRLRLRDGLPLDALDPRGRSAAARAVDDGLLDPQAHAGGSAVLTLRGRLLADAVIRELVA